MPPPRRLNKGPHPMRLLVYGMQSSGASLFTFFLAQRRDCLPFIDILNNYAAPRLDTGLDAVAKCVITTAYSLDEHIERFQPDRTLLFLRHPCHNYYSLQSKNYRNHSGLIDEKFSLLDTVFRQRDRFDAVVTYEDFLDNDPAVFARLADIGWPVDEYFFDYGRSQNDMVEFLVRHIPDLFDRLELSFGNHRGRGPVARFRDKPCSPDLEARVATLCPSLFDHYRLSGPGRAGTDTTAGHR